MHIGPWNEVFLILLHPHLHWLVASSLTSCVGRLYISVLPSTRNHQTMISCARCKQEAVHAGADGKVCACDRCKHHWCDPCAHELWGKGRGMLSCQLCNSELCVGHRRRLFRLAANVIFRHATFVQRKGRAKGVLQCVHCGTQLCLHCELKCAVFWGCDRCDRQVCDRCIFEGKDQILGCEHCDAVGLCQSCNDKGKGEGMLAIFSCSYCDRQVCNLCTKKLSQGGVWQCDHCD